jgi:adenylate kinase
MIIALTGTPGTGKTSVSNILYKKGFEIVDLNKVACEKNFLLGKDEKRASNIVDIDRFNKYVKENYTGKDIVLIEGHLSHLLKGVDKVFVLRCHPKKLKSNLLKKGWNKQKIKENVEAEILDIILCETLEIHKKENIFEIDVSDKSLDDVASSIIEIINNEYKHFNKYNIGSIDWSEEILKDFK